MLCVCVCVHTHTHTFIYAIGIYNSKKFVFVNYKPSAIVLHFFLMFISVMFVNFSQIERCKMI